MATNPTNQIDNTQLDPKQFPNEPWAQSLVAAFNKLVSQVINANNALQAKNPGVTYKDLQFLTGADPTTSFPIDVVVNQTVTNVQVAQVVSGKVDPSQPNTPQWRILASGKNFRISSITGLLANQHYTIRLALS